MKKQRDCQREGQCHLSCRLGGDIMSINGEGKDVKLLKDDFNGLNDVYREIADEIGIENAVAIYRLFHGTQVSFPGRLFSREHIHKAIVREYDGKNALQLAQKYNYSERTVWRILKEKKNF